MASPLVQNKNNNQTGKHSDRDFPTFAGTVTRLGTDLCLMNKNNKK